MMPRGVQPAARAGAVIAGADNPNALWYNPAGLVESKKQFLFDMTLPMSQTEFTRLNDNGDFSPTVKAPSARATIFTGILMLIILTAAWMASSMISRLCLICFLSAMP